MTCWAEQGLLLFVVGVFPIDTMEPNHELATGKLPNHESSVPSHNNDLYLDTSSILGSMERQSTTGSHTIDSQNRLRHRRSYRSRNRRIGRSKGSRSRHRPLVGTIFFVISSFLFTHGFLAPLSLHPSRAKSASFYDDMSPSFVSSALSTTLTSPSLKYERPRQTSTALSVWWFGGSELFEGQTGDTQGDSCELVPVRIERTSPNSRRILGEITAPNLSIEDVWSILTDYDRLTTHVPNLVESKMVARTSPGQPGDGQFTCKLYQKGAQKIVGFEFGASVTMNMREEIVSERERRIYFQCVDSFFFQEFDGEWRVVERRLDDGGVECTLSYVVDVRPKGPVPVAALEWRIREDVPTNLRAVKKAATEHAIKSNPSLVPLKQHAMGRQALLGNLRNSVTWERSETMAAYLDQQ